LSVGHYVLTDQRVVTEGPYAYLRHPIYTAALMIWVSVAIGFASAIAGLITIAYVVPAYYIYSRSEEKMMLQHFGDAYRVYRDGTGGFVPRLTQFRENLTQVSSSETNR
jgi:protein-S-isoprenylcysteine O-methyltransferase Ste14